MNLTVFYGQVCSWFTRKEDETLLLDYTTAHCNAEKFTEECFQMWEKCPSKFKAVVSEMIELELWSLSNYNIQLTLFLQQQQLYSNKQETATVLSMIYRKRSCG